jgi:hypothetical protein
MASYLRSRLPRLLRLLHGENNPRNRGFARLEGRHFLVSFMGGRKHHGSAANYQPCLRTTDTSYTFPSPSPFLPTPIVPKSTSFTLASDYHVVYHSRCTEFRMHISSDTLGQNSKIFEIVSRRIDDAHCKLRLPSPGSHSLRRS